jgi:clan AA aspartic protease
VTLRLRGRGDLTIECVLDTGFVGFLSLPAEAVSVLGLPFLYDTAANLADDSTIRLPVHEGIAVWNGQERPIRVVATGKRPLIGMSLLLDSELVVQCVEGGLVTLDTI